MSDSAEIDRPEFCLPPRKRLCSTQGPRYEVGESSSAAAARPTGGRREDYGFVGTMDTEIRRQRAEEVGYRIRDVWVDPREAVEEVAPMTLEGVNTRVTELAGVQEQDTQDIYAEALVSREAWGRSIEVSYMTRSEIMALRSIVMSQQAVISQFQAADCRSQTVTSEMLQADHMRQAEIAALWTFDLIMEYLVKDSKRRAFWSLNEDIFKITILETNTPLEREKARRHGKVYNWETATYGKIWYDEDIYDLKSVETEFPAIVLNDALTFEVTLSCEPTVSPLNDNKIEFRISFDESDDEDYTITILKTNTPYPSRKIRRIRACTHQRPLRNKDQYAVSRGLNTPYSRYGINIIFWKISSVVPTPRNTQYAISNSWIRLRMTEVIKGEFEKIKDVRVIDVPFTCDASLEAFNDKVSRLSKMDDDLFTYEVEVANNPCDSKMDNDLEQEVDDDMGYDPSDVAFVEWLGSKIFN
ncbi:hypothetical protein Tco_1546092 [Tanacetum coccineum]